MNVEKQKQIFLEQYQKIMFMENAPNALKNGDIEVMDVDDFIDQEKKEGDLINIDVKDDGEQTKGIDVGKVEEDVGDIIDSPNQVQDADIEKIVDPENREKQFKKTQASRTNRLVHNKTIIKVIDDNNNIVDPDKLKRLMTKRPTDLLGQNNKMKASSIPGKCIFYDLSIPAYQGLFYNEKENKFQIIKTCPDAGKCVVFCYATAGGYIQYPASAEKASRVMTFLMNDHEGYERQVIAELKTKVASAGKKRVQVYLRWHDSGDFFSEKYLDIAIRIAKQTPEVVHYAYTKRVDTIRKYINNESFPQNFVFNLSFGGTKDKSIDKFNDKHSTVIPKELFSDLFVGGKKWEFDEKGIQELKKRIAEHENIPLETIITWDEMMDKEVGHELYWNVIVWYGHGDNSAARPDVIGTLLLIH
jgi:hypothetical protein